MAERKCFTGDYRDEGGAWVTFRLWATDHDAAERAVEAIGATGRVLGELIEEGDGCVAQVGRA